MNSLNLSVSNLKRALGLLKKKESIQAKIVEIEHRLRRLEAQRPADDEKRVIPKSRRRGKKNRQGLILRVLKKAGEKGLSMRELAARTKIKAASLRVWMYTAGKKVPQLKKVSRGTFAYFGS